jgi:hypothetical protein
MLEYLDTTDSDSDFIPESDTDDTTDEEVLGRYGSKPRIKPKIITSYKKCMVVLIHQKCCCTLTWIKANNA